MALDLTTMTSVRIGEPEVLAKLPLTSNIHGQTWLSVVQGLHGVVKKKRQEICAAVDGDSVNIYEIQRGQNLISISVPPDATFACAPASIRSKFESGRCVRQTYCVVKRRGSAEIQLYKHEETEPATLPIVQKLTLGDVSARCLETVTLPHAGAVAVVFDDGGCRFFDADISRAIATGTLDCGSGSARIISITLLSPEEAAKSTLKNRPDILASTSEESVVACGVVRSSSDAPEGPQSLSYHVWTLKPNSTGVLEIVPVLSYPLSTDGHFTLRDKDGVSFAFKSTRLILQSSTKAIKYDLTSVIPRRISEFVQPTSDHISNIEISDNILLCSNSSSLQLYNSSFRSLQASIDLSRTGTKRKRGGSTTGLISLFAYFPSLNRVVGIRRNYLIAIDMLFPLNSNASAEFHQTSLLLQNVGKGAIGQARQKSHLQNRRVTLGVISMQPNTTDDWNSTLRTLNACSDRDDGPGFQTTFFQHLENAQQNGVNLRSSLLEHKINYVVSKLFTLHKESENGATEGQEFLKIRLDCKKLLIWLAQNGSLDGRKIAEVLHAAPTTIADRGIEHDKIVNALVDLDPTMHVLQEYIQHATYLSAEDLCQTTREIVLIALRNSTDDNNNSRSSLADATGETAIVPVTDGANINTAHIDSLLDCALARFAENSSIKISRELRKTFKRQELTVLIQILRQKLFRAGYTRSISNLKYPVSDLQQNDNSTEHDQSTGQKAELSLHAIVVILSSSLDAIGLLDANLGDSFAENLILELSTEVARTSEALEDAIFLQGVLRETLRYSESIGGGPVVQRDNSNAEAQKQKAGTIRTLYSETGADRFGTTTSSLPFSLRSEGHINQHKVRKGDGRLIERSKREMGMLQDRLRGPYSHERLVL